MGTKTGGEGAGTDRRLLVPLGSLLVLLCALGLYLTAPPPSPGAGRLILERAERILGAAPPGQGDVLVPSSTAWCAYLMAGIQEAAFRLSPDASRSRFLSSHHELWMRILRALWSVLAALVAAGAVRMVFRMHSRSARDALPGALLTLALLLASPLPALGIRDLAPFVPAALVALWLMDSALSRDDLLSLGIPSGLLLAWFPFLWPLIPLAALARGIRGRAWSRLAGFLPPAVLLGLILEPRHLTGLGGLPGLWTAEWLRGWGWGGPGGSGFVSLLGLVSVLGAGAWVLWIPGWIARRREKALTLFTAGTWILMVLVPLLSGLRRPVEAQYASAVLLAVWSGAGLSALAGPLSALAGPLSALAGPLSGRAGPLSALAGRRSAWLLGMAALLLAALALPGRLGIESAARRSGETKKAMLQDLNFHIAPDQMWLTDTDLAAGQVGAWPAPPLGLVLPRDSRGPGRYDYAYWPRWYAGFRWVLLSSARVRENLEREDASLPQAFYRSLQANADLVQSWGSGGDEGYRLYRIRPKSTWSHGLTEEELGGLSGEGGRLTWFLGRLGALYMEGEDPATAALLFRQGLEWDAEAVSLYNNLGAAYLREGEFLEASQAFEQGLRAQPQSFELLYNFALACAERGLNERAEHLLRRALTVRPDYAPIHYELARIFLEQGRRETARAALVRFLDLAAESPRRDEAEQQLRILDEDPSAGEPR